MKRLLITMSMLYALSCKAISKKEVYRMLIKYEVRQPKIVMKQICLETGHLTSKAYKHRNNIFGFKGGKMRFKSVNHCIRYYKQWQQKRYTKGNYYTFLRQIKYAKDKKYISKLKRIKI